MESTVAAAKHFGVTMLPFEAQNPAQIDTAFSSMRQQRAGALIVLLNPFFQQRSQQITALALKHRLPSMYGLPANADAGGLMSYGPNDSEYYRQAAVFVDKIFKGRKPADLPVEQPLKWELVINLKTAKTLGIKVPQLLVLQATRMIE